MTAMWKWLRSRRKGAEVGELSALNEHLKGLISNLADTSQQPKTADPTIEKLVERIEAVERRMEQVHEDAMRYLQQGAARHKRADRIDKKINEERDGALDDETQDLPAMEMPEPAEPTQNPLDYAEKLSDSLEYGREMLRKQGIAPL